MQLKKSLTRWRPLILTIPLLGLAPAYYWYLSLGVQGFLSETGQIVATKQSVCTSSSAGHASFPCWHAIVEYRVDATHKSRIMSEGAESPEPTIGSNVPILVNPRNRFDAVISGFKGYWFNLIILSILSFAFVVLGFLASWLPALNVTADEARAGKVVWKKELGKKR